MPHPLFFTVLLLLACLASMATDIYLPSFPAIQNQFHATVSAVQLSLSLYLAGLAIGQFIYGILSDRIGRKKVALLSLLIGLIGTFVCMGAVNISFLVGGRMLQGLGMGGSGVLFRAMLRDSYSGDTLAHKGSIVVITTSISMALAPFLGGYLQHFLEWRASFICVTAYIIMLLMSIPRCMHETNLHLNPLALQKKVLLQNLLHVLKNPIFLGYSLVASLVFGGLASYLTASPFLFQHGLHLTPIQYGWLAWIMGGSFCMGSFLNIFLIKRIGRHRSVRVGLALIILAGILMLGFRFLGFFNSFVIMFPMGLFAMGAAMSLANSFAAAFQPFAQMTGVASALFGCFQILGGALFSTLMAYLPETTQIPLGIVLTLIGLIAYLSQYLVFSRATHPPDSH